MSLKDEVMAVIEEIEQENRKGKKVPSYAMDVEVRRRFAGREKEVREALRALYKERRIEAGRTLNHIWIKAKTNTKDGI